MGTTTIIIILASLTTFFMGFGFSQLAFTIRYSRQIGVNSSEIKGLKEDFTEERERTDKRIVEVVELVKTVIEQNGKIINQHTTLIAEMKARG